MANTGQFSKLDDARIDNGTRTKTQGRLILLVEDDHRLREMVASVLYSEGYDVVELADGMEALNYLGASVVMDDEVRRPDLVISDIRMPTFSGLDLLVGLRDHGLAPPVMLITAVKGEEIRREARRLGATRVVSKPFDVDSFLHAVEESLDSTPVASDAEPEAEVPTPEV